MKAPSKKTVLSVDDDEVNQLVISSFLEGAGYHVVQVFSGEECLDYMRNAHLIDNDKGGAPDIILLDVVMPGMDGYQVSREIRKTFSATVPIIMISAKMSKEDIIRGLRFGIANDYLSKPFDRSVLLSKIEARIALADSVKASVAHHRDEFCSEMFKPLSEQSNAGIGAVLIVFRGGLSDKQMRTVLEGMHSLLHDAKISVLELQVGLVLLTCHSCDLLMETCCTVFGNPYGSDAVVRNAIAFVPEADGTGISKLLALAMDDVPVGTVRTTEEFYDRISEKSRSKFFKSNEASLGVGGGDDAILPRLATLLGPVDALMSRLAMAGDDQEFLASSVEALKCIEDHFGLSRSVPSSTHRPIPENTEIDRLCSADRMLDESLSSSIHSSVDHALSVQRYRSQVTKLISDIERKIGETKAALVFETMNLEALNLRSGKANHYRSEFTEQLYLTDDLATPDVA